MANYIELTSDEMKNKIDLIINLWHEFLKKTIPAYVEECEALNQKHFPFKDDDFQQVSYINVIGLREIFERVHQREDYFERYHKKLKMSNYKEIGLIAFWIVKLKPFHLKEEYFDEFFDFRVNEEFALYFIFNSIAQYAKELNKNYSLKKIDPDLYNELLYTMQYRDLSKEAYGAIVELLSVSTISD